MKKAAPSGLLCLVLLLLVFTLAAAQDHLVSSAEATENSWTSKAPMHEARFDLGVAVVNGKIYAIGGSTESSNSSAIVGANEEYNLESDTWTYKASMPTPRVGFAIAVYQNKIYCISGYPTSGETRVNEVYNPETDTWETKTPLPTPRQGLTANVVNGKIYLAGGTVPDETSSSGYSVSDLNEVYDPTNDSWTTKAPMPTATYGYASAVVDNKIYFIGGRSDNIHQIYDTETDEWSYGASPPSRMFGWSGGGAAAATTGEMAPKRIYVFSAVSTSNQVYNPENDSWTLGAEMPTKRQLSGVAVVNDTLYVIGGLTYHFAFPDDTAGVTATEYSVNEVYTPFGYGSDFTAPKVSVLSPRNETYYEANVSLSFTVDETASWMGFSLDGQDNVTITGNTTLTGLTNGLHNVTVYATDTYENTGISETINFTIAQEKDTKQTSELFPISYSMGIVAAIVLVLFGATVYVLKRKR